MEEEVILKKLRTAVRGLQLPQPADLRTTLATNKRAPKWKRRNVEALQGLVWHQELGWGDIEAVARYHTGSKSHLRDGGVESIAYTWAVRRNGQLVLCNNFDKATWSQGYRDRPGDENAEFMSVMFEGLFCGQDVTDPSAGEPNDTQMLAALILWRVCRQAWEWSEQDLYGHFLFGKPSCPGNTLAGMVNAVRANAPAAAFDLDTVTGRQEALAALGYYDGAIDGLWGPGSKGALVRFQEDHELATDSIWGPNTEAGIRQALKSQD